MLNQAEVHITLQIISRSEDETVSSALIRLGFQLIDVRMGINVSAPAVSDWQAPCLSCILATSRSVTGWSRC